MPENRFHCRTIVVIIINVALFGIVYRPADDQPPTNLPAIFLSSSIIITCSTARDGPSGELARLSAVRVNMLRQRK